MTETDLSQGPSANGAPGEGEQISGAAGERRSIEPPPCAPEAADRAAGRRRWKILACGAIVAGGALAFIRRGKRSRTQRRAQRRWLHMTTVARHSGRYRHAYLGRPHKRRCR